MNDFNGNFAKAFPERVTLMREAVAKHAAALRAMNPYGGLLDGPVSKFSHQLEEGDRVRLRHHKDGTQLRGRIETINNRGGLNILLDSGHHVLAHPELDQVEPEDFPSAESDVTVSRVQKQTNYDPFPGVGTLAKSVGGFGFHVGQKIRDRTLNKTASIHAIDEHRKAMMLVYEDGSDGMCDLAYAKGCMEIL